MKVLLDYHELRKNIEKMFVDAGIDDFADIDWIMVEVTGKQRSMLPFCGKFSSEETEKIMNAVQKRIKRIPLAYIFGKTNFFGYDFEVNENVLIPRLDTEVLIEKLIQIVGRNNKNAKILDVGTGSGAIAIVLQKETGADVTAIDVSEKALRVAKRNAKSNEADVLFIKSNLFENIPNLKFDFIVSNPPYIETETVKGLDPEVVLNEPILALDGGEDGLDFYRQIVSESPKHLNSKGKLYFEIGYNQADAVCELMKDKFKNITVYKDYGNNDRVVSGELI